MRSEAVAALLVVAIIAGAGVGYLVGNVNEHTTTLYSTTSFTQTITLYTNTTSTSTSTTCTNPPLIGCAPVDEPVILNAFVNQSSTVWSCSLVAQGSTAVCYDTISEGDSGTVVLNLTSLGGGSRVLFGTYSSAAPYVNFNSTYSCVYYSGLPDLNALSCTVSTAGSIYRFNYTVAQSLPAPEQAILTIVVTKTCCWP
jgi:hypothetical protein